MCLFLLRFLFSTGPDGLVTMVHHHPEDKYEVLSLKKVLASTLSAKVKVRFNHVDYTLYVTLRWSF